MRKLSISTLVAVLVLSACGEANEPTDVNETEPAAAMADTEEPQDVDTTIVAATESSAPAESSTTEPPELTEGTPAVEGEAPPATESKPGATPREPSDHPNPLVRKAVDDLAGRLDITVGEVTVVGIESVTWPDGSMGCPQPGMSYTQALVDGSRIELQVAGTTYWYHSGGVRDPFLCENPKK